MNDNRIAPLHPASSNQHSNRSGLAISVAHKKDPSLSTTETEKPANYQADVSEAAMHRQVHGVAAANEAGKAAAQEATEENADENLGQAVTKLNDYIQSVQRDLEFSVDDDSGRMVVKVIDRKTEEVVRQMPDDLALKMAQKLNNQEPLGLFNTKI